MKRNFSKIIATVLILVAGFSTVSVAEPDTGIWREAFQTTVPRFSQFTQGGFLNTQYGVAVGHFGEIRYTSDGGKTWNRSRSENSCRYSLDIVNDKVAWNCGDSEISVGKSIDAGASWQYMADIGQRVPNHCRYISFCDEDTGWVADLKKVKMTSDSGKNWVELKLPEGCVDLMAVFLRTSRDGYLLDMDGQLFVTTDGGATWTKKTVGETFKSRKMTPYIAMNFSDERNGFVVVCAGGETRLLSTIDGGSSWAKTIISTEISGYPYISRDCKFLTISAVAEPVLTVFQRQ